MRAVSDSSGALCDAAGVVSLIPDVKARTSPAPLAEAWQRHGHDVAAALTTDPRRGLRPAEARARLERYGANRLEAAERAPEWRKFLRQFADPLIYLLLAAVVVSLVAWMLEGGTTRS